MEMMKKRSQKKVKLTDFKFVSLINQFYLMNTLNSVLFADFFNNKKIEIKKK